MYDVVNVRARAVRICQAARWLLHLACADVGGCGGGVCGVEGGVGGGVEFSLCGEDEVDGVAASAVTSTVRGDVVCGGFGLRARVGGGDGKSAGAHDWKIDDVVAHVGEFVECDAGFGGNLFGCFELVGLSLVDEFEAEILRADGDGGGFTLGDDADAQAAEAREGDVEAVVCGEALELEPVALAVGARLAAV